MLLGMGEEVEVGTVGCIDDGSGCICSGTGVGNCDGVVRLRA